MGFNNGYNSGYEDARAELEPKMAALEKRVKELEASGGSGDGGGSPSPAVTGLVIRPSLLCQVVKQGNSAVYDTSVVPQVTLTPVDNDYPTLSLSGSKDILFVVTESSDVSLMNDGIMINASDATGLYMTGMLSSGVYMINADVAGISYWTKLADLDDLQNIPLAS